MLSYIVFFLLCILLLLGGYYYYNPFAKNNPHITTYINITNKRQPNYTDYIDEWINHLQDPSNNLCTQYSETIDKWEDSCRYRINHTLLWKKHRTDQYQIVENTVKAKEYRLFQFYFIRKHTRYRQRNYQKFSYSTEDLDNLIECSLPSMLLASDELAKIGYTTSRTKWNTQNQRSLMTKELRLKIMQRDHYTCQICGKYMPDGVGIHIDHIIPIAKGGKTVESNLQVLCSTCNLKKGSKIYA